MYKKKNRQKENVFTKYCNYIQNFMVEFNLFPVKDGLSIGKAFIALSGGMDSMALLYILNRIRRDGHIDDLIPVHINHGIRVESDEEEVRIREICDNLGLTVMVHRLEMEDGSNFEARAREERLSIFKSYLGPRDILYTAHHIDDSFEWSLMSRFKSGNYKSSIGIPLYINQIVRPFLSLTKNQIKTFVEICDISYFEDKTNKDNRFERNYLRNVVIPKIKERFPGVLKHYVNQSNLLVSRLKLSRLQGHIFKVRKEGPTILVQNVNNVPDFTGANELILNTIRTLSDSSRGVLGAQVDKIIRAAKRGKRGPLIFSGGVLGYPLYGEILFINRRDINYFAELDQTCLNKLINLNKQKVNSELIFGGLKFKKITKSSDFIRLKGQGRVHPIFERSTKYCLKNNILFNFVNKWVE